MMYPPLQFTADLFQSLDVQPIVTELLAAARADADGKAARTLLKSPAITLVVTVLRAGARLVEHAAPGHVLVVPLHGRVRFTAPARPAEAHVADRELLALGAGQRHEVTALEDAAFMLVIGGRSPTQ